MSFTPGPVSIAIGASTTAEVLGFDQYGQPMPLPDGTTVEYAIDNDAIASSSPNADGLTDAIVGVAAGVANLTATVTPPGGSALTDSQAITVTEAAPVLSAVKIAFGS